MVIKTEFDNPLEQDIVFEETDQKQSYEEILKNSENILKSFLYLKKMYSGMSRGFTEFDFISSENQKDFHVSGFTFSSPMVFTEGIKEKKSSFEVMSDETGTTVTFNEPKPSGLWVNIVVFT